MTKITEYIWKVDERYAMSAVIGNGDSDVALFQREASVEMTTSSEKQPRPVVTVRENADVNITWILQQFHGDEKANDSEELGKQLPASSFVIDRSAKTCRTPSRNDQTAAANSVFASLLDWCDRVRDFLFILPPLLPATVINKLDIAALNADSVFVPVLPLFEKNANKVLDGCSCDNWTYC